MTRTPDRLLVARLLWRERKPLDFVRAEKLVMAIDAGRTSAWAPLMAMLCPAILGFVRRSSSLGFRRSDEDTAQEILTTVLERLRRNDFRALHTYVAWRRVERNAKKTFTDWLRIVTDRVACDFVTRCTRHGALLAAVPLHECGTIALDAPPITDLQTVRELVEHAARALPPAQADAVRKIYEGKSPDDIAREANEERIVVDRRLRAAYARLRRWVNERSRPA